METPMKVQRTLLEFGSYGPVADAKAQTDCADGALPTVAFSSSPAQTLVDPLSPAFDPKAEDEEIHGEQSVAEDPTLGDGGKAAEPPTPEREKEADDAMLAAASEGGTIHGEQSVAEDPTLGDGGKAIELPEPECEKEAYDAMLAEVNKGKTRKRKPGMGAQPERMRNKRKRVHAAEEDAQEEQSIAEDPPLGDDEKAIEPPEPECEKEAVPPMLAAVNKGKTTKRKRGMGAQPERMRKKRKRVHAAEDEACGSGAQPERMRKKRKRVHAAEDEACGSGALPKKKKRSAKSQEERAQPEAVPPSTEVVPLAAIPDQLDEEKKEPPAAMQGVTAASLLKLPGLGDEVRRCSKCKEPIDDILKCRIVRKGAAKCVCNRCGTLHVGLIKRYGRWPTPEFVQISAEEQHAFWKSAKAFIENADLGNFAGEAGKEVDKLLAGVMQQVYIEERRSGSTAEYLPLSVWATRGFDTKAIEARCEQTRDDPILGKCYKVEIHAESISKVHQLMQQQVMKLKAEAKSGKKTKKDKANANDGEPESDADGNEDLAPRRAGLLSPKELQAKAKKMEREKKNDKRKTELLCNRAIGKLAPVFVAYTKVRKHASFSKLPSYICDGLKDAYDVCDIFQKEASESVGVQTKVSFQIEDVERAFKSAEQRMKDAIDVLDAFSKF